MPRLAWSVSISLLVAAAAVAQPVGQRLAALAEAQVGVTTIYDPAYVRIPYPGGDIPIQRGVCADVIVRAFRGIGVDLQAEVHRDISRDFAAYPQLWNLRAPDRNIDHRRVPNLMKYFARRGKSIPLSSPYIAGDVVAWRLDNGLYHIGIVSRSRGSRDALVVHNIGSGARTEDVLRKFRIIGHYRW